MRAESLRSPVRPLIQASVMGACLIGFGFVVSRVPDARDLQFIYRDLSFIDI